MFKFIKRSNESKQDISKFEKCTDCNNRLDELRKLKKKQKHMIENPNNIKTLSKKYFGKWYEKNEYSFMYHDDRCRIERTLRELIFTIEDIDAFAYDLKQVKSFEEAVVDNDKKINDLMIELELK